MHETSCNSGEGHVSGLTVQAELLERSILWQMLAEDIGQGFSHIVDIGQVMTGVKAVNQFII
jgi:hypothetical protein